MPLKDLSWLQEQKPRVVKLWLDCWLADANGIDWMPIDTNLSYSAFRDAKNQLSAQNLFVFRRVSIGADGRTSCWEVKNLNNLKAKKNDRKS
jgi:hypothetical protein